MKDRGNYQTGCGCWSIVSPMSANWLYHFPSELYMQHLEKLEWWLEACQIAYRDWEHLIRDSG